MRPISLFTLFGLTTSITPASLIAFGLAAIGLSIVALIQANLSVGEGLAAGGLGALIMFAGDWLHQLGHAWAARRTGYPMTGMRYHSIFAASEYPPDEPPLPARVHLSRALGGFWVNLLIGLLLLPYAFFTSFQNSVLAWLLGFAVFYNLVVLGLGALLPIDIPGVFTNDGGTIWRYWRRKTASRDGGRK